MLAKFLTGNFNNENQAHRGWFVGHFMEPDSPFYSQDLEIKWARHKKGEIKGAEATNDVTTLSILIYGKFLVKFSTGKEVLLEKEGDYLFYKPNIPPCGRNG